MNLERIIAENMLRFGVKNLNDSDVKTIQVKASHNIYSDYTYINEWGKLVESGDLRLILENQLNEQDPADPDQGESGDSGYTSKQSGLRKLTSKIRRSIQRTPLMSKWQAWNQKRWLKKKGLPPRSVLEEGDTDEVRNTPGYKEVIDLLYNKRTRDEGSILYWYGTEVLGGAADPEANQLMSNAIERMKAINGKTIESTKPESEPITLDLNGFIAKLEEMQNQNVYVTGEDLMTIFDTEASPALNELFSAIATGKSSDGEYTYNISSPQVLNDIAENYNNSGDSYQADGFYDAMAIDLKRLQNFATKLVLGAGKEEIGTFAVSMQPKDKIAMIPRILAMHQTNVQENPKLTWQDYTSFYINPNAATIKANLVKLVTKTTEGDEQEAYASYYSYPDNPNDPATKDAIYGNQDNATTWENTSDFEAEMKRRIDAIVANGGEIYRIEYNAGARSSTVGTTKYGASETDMKAKTEGNVQLCIDRATGITNGMKPVIDKLLPNLPAGAKAMQKPNLHPNRGPGWYQYDLEGTPDANGKLWGKGYGPIYTKIIAALGGYEQARKARGGKYALKPQLFYICRNNNSAYEDLKKFIEDTKSTLKLNLPTQADIEAEYEATFGPHRGTYAGYVLFYTLKPNPTPAPPEEEIDAKIETVGTWSFSLDYNIVTWGDFSYNIKSRWKRFKRKIKKFKIPKLALSFGGGVIENLVHECDAYN